MWRPERFFCETPPASAEYRGDKAMTKLPKPKIVRLGTVKRETKAVFIIGSPEFGNPMLSYTTG
jgi:hypothetical protein